MYGKTMIFKMLYLMTYAYYHFETWRVAVDIHTYVRTNNVIIRLLWAMVMFVDETNRLMKLSHL